MYVGRVVISAPILANEITWRNGVHSSNGTMDISLYSDDGQTRVFSVTTATITSTGYKTTTLSSVAIEAGVYYIAFNGNSTEDFDPDVYTDQQGSSRNLFQGWGTAGGSEPIYEGTLTITGGTPPATIDPTAITTSVAKTLVFRLDN
jgi:hypothetical protein